MRRLIVGTRGSPLALSQTKIVLDALRLASPATDFELKTIRTEGDRRLDVSLEEAGGQGLFVKDIEHRLLAGEIDLAVHSLKDMPATLMEDLIIGAVLERGNPRDALVSPSGRALKDLPANARIGTDSRRRAVQLQGLRPDVQPLSIRGNVDTRIHKAETGEYEAVCLAAAGLARLGLLARASQIFSIEEMLPAVGQAVLAIEARSTDMELLELLRRVDHPATRAAMTAERAYLARLGAGCRLPVGAYAVVEAGSVHIRGLLATAEGHLFRDEATGPEDSAAAIGTALADRLLALTVSDGR
jgi:hydroxymethylbilane synthase